ncbi:transketolase C-terminal domain-containing protein [Microbacterium sp. P5_E9]
MLSSIFDPTLSCSSRRQPGRAVIVHHATAFAGPGAEIAAQINEKMFGELLEPVQRVGARCTPIPARASESVVTLRVEDIVSTVRSTLKAANI